MKANSFHTFLLFIGMGSVLFVALMIDHWINLVSIYARNSFPSSGNYNFLLFASPAGLFIVVGLCVFLCWFVIHKSPPNILLSVLFISTGLLVSFYNIVIISLSFQDIPSITFLYPFSSSTLHLTASIFIVLIGFINVFRYTNQSNRERS